MWKSEELREGGEQFSRGCWTLSPTFVRRTNPAPPDSPPKT